MGLRQMFKDYLYGGSKKKKKKKKKDIVLNPAHPTGKAIIEKEKKMKEVLDNS